MAQEREISDIVPFREGDTVVIGRDDYKHPEQFQDQQEQALAQFFNTICQDPNIVGVAISRMNYGGIYTDWFVKDLLDNEGKGKRSLEVTGESYQHLKMAAGDQTGYGSFTMLGNRSFEETEKKFRENWSVVDPNNPFSFGEAHGQDLELLGIIKIEN